MRHTAYVSNFTPLRVSNLACASSSPSTPAEYRSSWSTLRGSVAATRSTTCRTSGAKRLSRSSFEYVTGAGVGAGVGVARRRTSVRRAEEGLVCGVAAVRGIGTPLDSGLKPLRGGRQRAVVLRVRRGPQTLRQGAEGRRGRRLGKRAEHRLLPPHGARHGGVGGDVSPGVDLETQETAGDEANAVRGLLG